MVTYEFEDDCVRMRLPNGESYLIDTDDYENVSAHVWFKCGYVLATTIDGHKMCLPGFLTNTPQGTRVMRRNGNAYDCRKSNLYCENEYLLKNDYYEVTTFSGDKFKISKEDYDLVSANKWVVGSQGYVTSKTKYNNQTRTIKLHRLIMNVIDDSIEVDHINRDPRDNRRENLRLATRSENMSNVGIGKYNKSGVLGVYWNKQAQKWAAQVKRNKISYYLGLFQTIEEAAKARQEKLKTL